MAAATAGARMTPLASLLDTIVQAAQGHSLPTYLAMHRAPGTDWKTYDQIAEDLTALTGRDLNRVTIKTFTETMFGIPDTRYVDTYGRRTAMPRPADADTIAAYINVLDRTYIDTDLVVEYAGAGLARHLAAVAETAALIGDPDAMQAIADGDGDLKAGRTS